MADNPALAQHYRFFAALVHVFETSLPDAVAEGDVVRCADSGKVLSANVRVRAAWEMFRGFLVASGEYDDCADLDAEQSTSKGFVAGMRAFCAACGGDLVATKRGFDGSWYAVKVPELRAHLGSLGFDAAGARGAKWIL